MEKIKFTSGRGKVHGNGLVLATEQYAIVLPLAKGLRNNAPDVKKR